MIKENYPMRINRDDTEHGVFYYSEKDVMKMLEIARIEERKTCVKILHDNSTNSKGMAVHALIASAQQIEARGKK